jgi:hypothetical protein
LNKKDKNKETKEKEKPKINEIVIDIELPTGQADPQFDFEITDYKGNIIPEHLRFVYIPGKGSWPVDQFKRTLFDEYHEKRDQIPKPRLYLFNIIKSKIKSNAVQSLRSIDLKQVKFKSSLLSHIIMKRCFLEKKAYEEEYLIKEIIDSDGNAFIYAIQMIVGKTDVTFIILL